MFDRLSWVLLVTVQSFYLIYFIHEFIFHQFTFLCLITMTIMKDQTRPNLRYSMLLVALAPLLKAESGLL